MRPKGTDATLGDVTSRRRLATISALAVAAAVALVFAPGEVAPCLGPLGVTRVQRSRLTGIVPGVGPGLPILVAVAALALFVVLPPRRIGIALGAAGASGAVLGAIAYALFRERTMDGPTSSGEWISITRPFDPGLGITVAIGAAALAAFIWGHGVEAARRRTAAGGG